MTDAATPTGRLRGLLDEIATEGYDVATIRDLILPAIPLGDAEHWMRASVGQEIRKYLKSAGLVLNHAAIGEEDGVGARADVWVQYSIPEVVTHIQHVRKQMADDDAALERRLEIWVDANPNAGHTVESLRQLAEDGAA